MKVLCFEYRVVTLPYFLDEMQTYEVVDCIDNLQYLDRNSWEQCRFQVYANAQMNTKKQLKPTDIMKLPFDTDTGEADGIEITNEEIERLKKKSQKIIEDRLNGK